MRAGSVIGIASLSFCAALFTAAQTDPPGLPPGHPKVDAPGSAMPAPSAVARELPPDHPKIDSPSDANAAELPPGHPQVRPGTSARNADEILKQLDSTPDLKQREKTFEVAMAVGKLYYAHSRYADAAEYLGQAAKKAEPARALYLEQLKRAKAAGPVHEACGSLTQNTMEAQTAASRQLASKGNAKGAAECARAALEPALEVEELRANALFLSGNSTGALTSYERALAISSDRTNSLYGRASILFETKGDDVKALRQAKDDWTRFLKLEPNGSKSAYGRKLLARADEAIAAGGLSKLAQKKEAQRKAATPGLTRPLPPAANQQLAPVSPEVAESIRNTERTPELERGLAKLVEEGEEHLAHQRYQDALDAYKRVVPFQPENGRAKAGMAWALVGLQRQPMADRVWSVAVEADPGSVEKLGDALTSKGDKAGAKALWKKLSETSPSYAQRSGLAAKLK